MLILKINDYVRYGSNGVCKVIGRKMLSGADRYTEKEYYALQPVADGNSMLYVPVGNEALLSKMTAVLGKEEIDNLILSAKDNEIKWKSDKNERNAYFLSILKENNPRTLLMMINCIYLKKQELLQIGKKLSATDEGVLKRAEIVVQNEFSFSLNIPKSEVGGYIRHLLGIQEIEVQNNDKK